MKVKTIGKIIENIVAVSLFVWSGNKLVNTFGTDDNIQNVSIEYSDKKFDYRRTFGNFAELTEEEKNAYFNGLAQITEQEQNEISQMKMKNYVRDGAIFLSAMLATLDIASTVGVSASMKEYHTFCTDMKTIYNDKKKRKIKRQQSMSIANNNVSGNSADM